MLTPQWLRAQAQARPQHPALWMDVGPDGACLSYGRLHRLAAELALLLRRAGVTRGQVVALFGPHDWRFAAAVHALAAMGAQVAPMPAQGPQALWAARLARAQASWAVCVGSDAVAQDVQQAVLEALGRPCVLWHPELAKTRHTPWAPLEAASEPIPADAQVLVLETSGTSGTPTPVVLRWSQILAQAVGSAARLGHSPEDVWLDVLPLHHVGGLMILFRALMFGATVSVPGRFDAAQVARALGEGHIHLLSLVPTMLQRLLPHLAKNPSPCCSPRVRAILLGGAPTPQPLYDEALALGMPVALTWGMTEAASGVCVAYPGTRSATRNAGPPIVTAHVFADPQGVLHVAGPTVGGTFKTSDRGQVLADGTVEIFGRADRVIISGGENIAPEELEAVLLSHPQIVDAAVVGCADALWGERPVAHVVAAAAQVPSDSLVDFCRARLASFKVPTRFVWHAQLPRDALGKLQRASLLSEGGEDVG